MGYRQLIESFRPPLQRFSGDRKREVVQSNNGFVESMASSAGMLDQPEPNDAIS